MLLLWLACAPPLEAPLPLIDLVDPFVATGGQGFGQGSASPAATQPFGFVKLGPDTTASSGAPEFAHCSGYWYEDPYIAAFSHTRLHGTGVSDGGTLGVMPVMEPTADWKQYMAPLDHAKESASPGYYSVELEGRALVELTATLHAGVHRYTWEDEPGWLHVDLAHTAADHDIGESWLEIDTAAQELRGYVLMQGSFSRGGGGQPFWFVLKSSRPWVDELPFLEEAPVPGRSTLEGHHTAVSLQFTGDVELSVGLSSVSLDGARGNLDTEVAGRGFDAVRADALASWDTLFERFELAGGTAEQRVIAATALYHAFQMPTLYTDVSGHFRGVNRQVHRAVGWTYYSDFSLWDTYRTLHPFVQLAWPELAADHARSLTSMGNQIGFLPKWPQGVGEAGTMLGASADVVLGESVLKGITDFPTQTAWDLAWASASDPESTRARAHLQLYQDYGYVPYDDAGSSVSHTLEYAVNDHALGLWARWLGEDDAADELMSRAQSFENVFDAETEFMRGRNRDGSWAKLEDSGWGDAYAEGNAWQYTWLAPHDAPGLAGLFGGRDALFAKLTDMFERSRLEPDTWLYDPYYWHGNEPDLHAALLYAQLGRPDDTARWVRWIQDNRYAADPAGLDGNDDGGTLSAWYLFTSMGLYPVNGTDLYVLTTPIFDRFTLRRSQGDLEIRAAGAGDYIQAAFLDGVELHSAMLTHEELVGEHTLQFVRSPVPTGWASW